METITLGVFSASARSLPLRNLTHNDSTIKPFSVHFGKIRNERNFILLRILKDLDQGICKFWVRNE
jgi:hypothetical protein